MREASESKTATDTDSYAFSFHQPPTRGRPRQKLLVMKFLKFWLVITVLCSSISVYGWAYKGFPVDSITYIKISPTQVCAEASIALSTDTIIIPPVVKAEDGKVYQVTRISHGFWSEKIVYAASKDIKTSPQVLRIPASIEVIETETQGSYGGYTYYYGLLTDDFLKLSSIEVSQENKYYASLEGVLFSKDFKTLYRYPNGSSRKEYSIPNGVEEIFDRAFENSYVIQSIVMPNTVKSIRKSAFAYCEVLHDITLSDSLQIVQTDAFQGSDITSTIILPSTLEYIGDDAFSCYNSNTVYCYAERPPKLLEYKGDEQPFNESTLMHGKLHVLKGSKGSYLYAAGWKEFMNVYEDLEKPIEEEVAAHVLLSTSESLAVNLTYPQGYNAEFAIEENEDWHLYSIVYNGVDVTDKLKNNTFTTPALEGQNNLQIIMASGASVNAISKSPKVSITREGDDIHINNIKDSALITIYDLNGHMLYQGKEHIIGIVDKGIYIIHIDDQVLKLFI